MDEDALAAPLLRTAGGDEFEAEAAVPAEPSLDNALNQINDGHWRKLLFHSLGLAVMILILLWRSGGEPLLAVWSLSLLFISYFFCSACVLSTVTPPRCCSCVLSTVATPRTMVFFALSYAALLALFADVLLSRVVGMVIIYLDSVLAAGCFGCALAEHNGTEELAAAAAAKTRVPANEKQKKLRCAKKKSVRLLLGVLTLGSAARVAWVVCPFVDYSVVEVAANLSGALAYLLFFYIFCVLKLLRGAILGDESDFAVVVWNAVITMLTLSSCFLLGELAGVIAIWLCVLASTVFLGYCLRVHASYNQIMRGQHPVTLLEDLDYKVRLQDTKAPLEDPAKVEGFQDTKAPLQDPASVEGFQGTKAPLQDPASGEGKQC